MTRLKTHDAEGNRIAGSGISRHDCRSWEYQWEPFGVTHALVLRQLMEETYRADDQLFWSVWDDLVQCLYWTTNSPELNGEPTYVFKHGQGMRRSEDLRDDIRDDLLRTLQALGEDGVVEGSIKKGWRLTSYRARAQWFAERAHTAVTIYKARIPHGSHDYEVQEHREKGMDIFRRNSSELVDEFAEKVRNSRLDVARQRYELREAESNLEAMEESLARG